MSKQIPITFAEFIAQEQARVETFRRWWASQATLHPKHFPPMMWAGDWNEQLSMFDPYAVEIPPADADTWKEIIHSCRRKIDFSSTFCKTFEQFECHGEIVDHFFQNCLVSLNSANKEGVAEFVVRLNAHLADLDHTPETIHKLWNHPQHPIRNFLISRTAIYPEPRIG